MINNSEPKADGLNQTETLAGRASDGGGRPISLDDTGRMSKRKRAYHRALKQRRVWALVNKSMNDIAADLMKKLYA